MTIDDEAQTPTEPAPRRRRLGAVTETIVIVAGALLLSFLIKTFLVQPFSIPRAPHQARDRCRWRRGEVL